jgi:hypothetical protein
MAELTGKSISELPEATSLDVDNDLLALSSNGTSRKLKVSTLINDRYKVVKFPNGWMIQIQYKGFTGVSFSSMDGSLYYNAPYTDPTTGSTTAYLYLGQWDQAFATGSDNQMLTVCSVQTGNKDVFLGKLSGTSATQVGTLYAYAPTAGTGNFGITVFAFGRWK